MESVLQITALVAIVLFIISLAIDLESSLLIDFLPERFVKKLRWILGTIAFISIVLMIIYK